MKGSDITKRQIDAAKQYLMLRYCGSAKEITENQKVCLTFGDLSRLVAEYAVIRMRGIESGGTIDEPGEVFLTGK